MREEQQEQQSHVGFPFTGVLCDFLYDAVDFKDGRKKWLKKEKKAWIKRKCLWLDGIQGLLIFVFLIQNKSINLDK